MNVIESVNKFLKVNFPIIISIKLFIQNKQIFLFLLIPWLDHIAELLK